MKWTTVTAVTRVISGSPPGDGSPSVAPRDPVQQGPAVPQQPVRPHHPVPDAPSSGVIRQCDFQAGRKMERRLEVAAVARFARAAGPGQFQRRASRHLRPLHARRELPGHTDGGGPAAAVVRDVLSSIESHGDEPNESDGNLTDRHVRSGARDPSEIMRTDGPRQTAGTEARVQASANRNIARSAKGWRILRSGELARCMSGPVRVFALDGFHADTEISRPSVGRAARSSLWRYPASIGLRPLCTNVLRRYRMGTPRTCR